MCKRVLYYCHRATTQLHLTNISYHVRVVLNFHQNSDDRWALPTAQQCLNENPFAGSRAFFVGGGGGVQGCTANVPVCVTFRYGYRKRGHKLYSNRRTHCWGDLS